MIAYITIGETILRNSGSVNGSSTSFVSNLLTQIFVPNFSLIIFIELGVNVDTLYGWNKRAKDARLDLEPGTQTPDTAMSLTEEVQKLRQQTREQAKEIARLKEENEFLAEASAFFAASRRKSAKI